MDLDVVDRDVKQHEEEEAKKFQIILLKKLFKKMIKPTP
jgi:hypothetical protein